MPSLLESGSIVKQAWMSAEMKQKIDAEPNIEVLMYYIEKMMWAGKTEPEMKLRGPGDKVLLLHSGTGSGKSTLLPPYLYKTFRKPNIIITQPTRIITADIPYQILQYNDFLAMGDNIGFQTASSAWKPGRGILFSTYGILLQYLKTMSNADFMRKYSYVIIDEVHKRTLEIDNCLFLLKRMFEEHWEDPTCPLLILMSATFEPKIFMDYFGCKPDHFIRVTGATFPIEKHYAKFDCSDYVTYATDLIERLHVTNLEDLGVPGTKGKRYAIDVGGVKGNDEDADVLDQPAADVPDQPADDVPALPLALPADPEPVTGAAAGSIFRDIMVFVQGRKQIVELETRIHALNANIFAKGMTEARIHSDAEWKKYTVSGGASAPTPQYLVPVMMMSETIEEGGASYKTLFSDIESVTVDIYEIKAAQQKGGARGYVTGGAGITLGKVLRTVPGSRRVILATNAAETGLTIDTLRYCIDTGFAKESIYNPVYGCASLLDKNVTGSSHHQRIGRVGRKDPGISYGLFTAKTHAMMPAMPHADIIKGDVTYFVLNAIIMAGNTEIEHTPLSNVTSASFQRNQFDQAWSTLVSPQLDADNVPVPIAVMQFASSGSSTSGGSGKFMLGGDELALQSELNNVSTLHALARGGMLEDADADHTDADHAALDRDIDLLDEYNAEVRAASPPASPAYISGAAIANLHNAVFAAADLDFMQYPSADSIGSSIEKLFGLGFITHEYRATIFGYFASKFRKVRPESVRMIIAGYHHHANVLDLVTIAAFLEVGSFGLGIDKRKYVPRNPLNVSKTLSYYYFRLLFSDEFIEYLFIWREFMAAVDKHMGAIVRRSIRSQGQGSGSGSGSTARDSMRGLEDWAESVGIKLAGLFHVVARRDEIIADMLAMGLNPYHNGLDLPPGSYDLVKILRRNLGEGMEEVRKIKKCIYEGFRLNLCTWNVHTRSYTSTERHYTVEVSSKLQMPVGADGNESIEQRRPHYIVVSDVLMRESMTSPGMYTFTAGDVSVLDGFVDVDLAFMSH